MRYCFFDVDGVLNTSKDWKIQMYSLQPKLVDNFCKYLIKHKYEPVLISSWRAGFIEPNHSDNSPQIKRLEKMMAERGIVLKFKTPILKGRTRDAEIERFLYYNPAENYVIIDDDRTEYAKTSDQNVFIDCNRGFNLK